MHRYMPLLACAVECRRVVWCAVCCVVLSIMGDCYISKWANAEVYTI